MNVTMKQKEEVQEFETFEDAAIYGIDSINTKAQKIASSQDSQLELLRGIKNESRISRRRLGFIAFLLFIIAIPSVIEFIRDIIILVSIGNCGK